MRKNSASPFESKLIFSYSCETSVLKKRQEGNNYFDQASNRDKDIYRRGLFSQETLNRPKSCLIYRMILRSIPDLK